MSLLVNWNYGIQEGEKNCLLSVIYNPFNSIDVLSQRLVFY